MSGLRGIGAAAIALTVWLGQAVVAAQERDLSVPYNGLLVPANIGVGVIPGTSVDATSGSAIQPILDAGLKDKVGSIAFGWKDGQGQFQVLLSAPLDSNNEATPISLLGLPAGASAKIGFNRLLWRGPNPSEQRQAEMLCRDRNIPISNCTVRRVPRDVSERLADLEHLTDIPWFFGGDVGVERAAFTYLEKGTLAALTENHESVTLAGRIGYFSSALGFVIGHFKFKNAFLPAGAPTQVCRGIEGSSATRCDAAVIGAPREQQLHVVGVEVRRFMASTAAAVALTVQRDLKQGVTSVDVPVYFMRNALGAAIGGVRFGWRSDTKEMTAIAFVGAALGTGL